MKFASYIANDEAGYGLLQDNGDVLDLRAADADLPTDLAGFIAAGESAMAVARKIAVIQPSAARRLADSLTLTAPIPRP